MHADIARLNSVADIRQLRTSAMLFFNRSAQARGFKLDAIPITALNLG